MPSTFPATHRRTAAAGATAAVLLVVAGACSQLAGTFHRETLPDLGPQIPLAAKLELDPSVAKARAQYVDSCGRLQVLQMGSELEDFLVQATYQGFSKVVTAGETPDVTIRIRLLQPSFKLQQDNVYDRIPAELTLDGFAEYRDKAGALIAEQPLQLVHQQRLRIEPMQKNCDYITSDLRHDAAVKLATLYIRDAQTLFKVSAPPQGLAVKAVALDANQNGVWESQETVRIRVDVTNGAKAAVQGVTVKLAVPAALSAPFGTTAQSIGMLGPGETRSAEFSATVPPGLSSQDVAFTASAADSAGGTATAPAVVARLAGGGSAVAPPAARPAVSDDIGAVPASNGWQRPQVFLISVGISAHRDTETAVRKYAASDAELVTAYFEALGGVPPANVRLLQDRKALRPDIEEAVLDWLPSRVSPESLVIVYFSGQAKVAASGDVFLVPYEGGAGSTARLYPLKDLQAALSRLKARHVAVIFDGPVSRIGDAKGKAPQWDTGDARIIRLIGHTAGPGGAEPETLRHGLFTYYLVRGLRGEADDNLNGEVTLGELAAYLGQAVPAAAKMTFNREQRPLIVPVLDAAHRSSGVILTKTASLPNGQR